jgi:hypothetical protein
MASVSRFRAFWATVMSKLDLNSVENTTNHKYQIITDEAKAQAGFYPCNWWSWILY